MFTLCETQESVELAAAALSKAPYVVLDCEGRDLGTQDGQLSILSLGTPHAQEIYVIDFVTLSPDALQPILSLLAGDKVRKVVWDGRMDFNELFYAFSTAIDTNVLDLQVVDIKSREIRGHTESMRKRRLSRHDFPFPEVLRLQLEDLHRLSSLDYALEEHSVRNVAAKESQYSLRSCLYSNSSLHFTAESVADMHSQNESDKWLQRPLPELLLQYAANDITRIAGMYDKFVEKNYLLEPEEQLEALLRQSTRYVGTFRDTGRPAKDNALLQSGIMPFHVFAPELDGWSADKLCKNCKTFLPLTYFPFVPGTKRRYRRENCRICTLILAREAYEYKPQARRSRSHWEDDDAYEYSGFYNHYDLDNYNDFGDDSD